MYKFTLSTDSTCDLYHDFLVENDIPCAPLSFTLDKDGVVEDCLDNFTEYSQYVDFYNKIRAGAMPKTSILNYESHYKHFKKLAEGGAKEIVHITLSSGLARTREIAAQAAEDVRKDFPEFQVYVVDPLTATVGTGLLVRVALKYRNKGKTAQETVEFVNSLRLHIQHYIVADDLNHLKRGGRISPAVAAIGGILNVKPILSFDNEGKLFSYANVRGTKKAISFIESKLLKEGPVDVDGEKYVLIVHTDNEPMAEELAKFVRETIGVEPYVQIMGPVIGTHVGPGSFALGYVTKSGRNEF